MEEWLPFSVRDRKDSYAPVPQNMGMLKNIVKGILLRNGLDDDQKSAAKKFISLGLSVLNKHEMGNLIDLISNEMEFDDDGKPLKNTEQNEDLTDDISDLTKFV